MQKKGAGKLSSKAAQLAELQRQAQSKKQAELVREAEAAKNDGFYGMDELAEMLGLSTNDFQNQSRASSQAHQVMNFMSNQSKESKVVDNFSEVASAYP